MPFDADTLATLVETFKVRFGIADNDPLISVAALLVTDDGSSNTTSSTIRKIGNTITLTGNTTGTDTINLTGNTTLQDVADTINGYGDGRAVTVIGPDPDFLARSLIDFTDRSILDTSIILLLSATTRIEAFLQSALAKVETYCRTALFDDGTTVKTVTAWNNGDGATVLDDANVNAVDWYAVETEQAIAVTYTGAGRASVEITEDATLLLRTRPAGGPTTTTTITLDDDTDISDVAASIAAVSGWSATTYNDGPSTRLVPMPTERVRTATVDLHAWVDADGDYRLDREAGIVYLDELTVTAWADTRARGQARVAYRAGFTTLPDDLEAAILNVAKAGLDASSRSFGLQSESLGDYSYATAPGEDASAAMSFAVSRQTETVEGYRRRLP